MFKQPHQGGIIEMPYADALRAGIEDSFLSRFNALGKGKTTSKQQTRFSRTIWFYVGGKQVDINDQGTDHESITRIAFSGDALDARNALLRRFRMTIGEAPDAVGGL